MSEAHVDNGQHIEQDHSGDAHDASVSVDRKSARIASIAEERAMLVARRDQLIARKTELEIEIKDIDGELTILKNEEAWINKAVKPKYTRAQAAVIAARAKKR